MLDLDCAKNMKIGFDQRNSTVNKLLINLTYCKNNVLTIIMHHKQLISKTLTKSISISASSTAQQQ